MALITGTIAVIWQGGVYLVNRKLAKELIKLGYKYLTSKNYKKSFEFFKGKKKLNISEKNKVLENLNIKTKKISPKKIKPKEDPNPWKGIRKNETIEQFLTRQAATAKSVKKVDDTIAALTAARAGTKIKPALSKETQKIIENIKKARAKDKTIVKATETEQAKTLVQAAKSDKLPAPISKVKDTLAKGTKVAEPVAKKGSTTWEKAKTAMKLAGWSLPIIAGGGIFFYSTRDKDKDIKETTDIKVDKGITKAEDITITTAKPDDTIPPVDPVDPFFKKRETLADKVQSLDFDKDIEIITKEHPSVIKKTLPKTLPGFVRTQTDTGL
jgi:hypothetical protein